VHAKRQRFVRIIKKKGKVNVLNKESEIKVDDEFGFQPYVPVEGAVDGGRREQASGQDLEGDNEK